jgi:hypothetical protein
MCIIWKKSSKREKSFVCPKVKVAISRHRNFPLFEETQHTHNHHHSVGYTHVCVCLLCVGGQTTNRYRLLCILHLYSEKNVAIFTRDGFALFATCKYVNCKFPFHGGKKINFPFILLVLLTLMCETNPHTKRDQRIEMVIMCGIPMLGNLVISHYIAVSLASSIHVWYTYRESFAYM